MAVEMQLYLYQPSFDDDMGLVYAGAAFATAAAQGTSPETNEGAEEANRR